MRKPQLTKRRRNIIIVLSVLAALVCVYLAPEIDENESAVDGWTFLHIAFNMILGVMCAYLFMYHKRLGFLLTAVVLTIQFCFWAGVLGIVGWELLEQNIFNHIWADAGESLLNSLTDIFIGLASFLLAFGWMLHRLRSNQRRR